MEVMNEKELGWLVIDKPTLYLKAFCKWNRSMNTWVLQLITNVDPPTLDLKAVKGKREFCKLK